jgi:hypothetical protein
MCARGLGRGRTLIYFEARGCESRLEIDRTAPGRVQRFLALVQTSNSSFRAFSRAAGGIPVDVALPCPRPDHVCPDRSQLDPMFIYIRRSQPQLPLTSSAGLQLVWDLFCSLLVSTMVAKRPFKVD